MCVGGCLGIELLCLYADDGIVELVHSDHRVTQNAPEGILGMVSTWWGGWISCPPVHPHHTSNLDEPRENRVAKQGPSDAPKYDECLVFHLTFQSTTAKGKAKMLTPFKQPKGEI